MAELYKNQYRITSARLKHADYGNGVYFVTICTKDKTNYFGEIMGTEGECIKELNTLGKHVETCIESIENHFKNSEIISYMVMPNHVHFIIHISNDNSPHGLNVGKQTMNLPSVIRGFKGAVTSFAKKNNIEFAWQSGYYERIIREHENINNYIKYIEENPIKWFVNKCDDNLPEL